MTVAVRDQMEMNRALGDPSVRKISFEPRYAGATVTVGSEVIVKGNRKTVTVDGANELRLYSAAVLVIAGDRAVVQAHRGAVIARDTSLVEARNRCRVQAYNRAHVLARGEAVVHAYDQAVVEAVDRVRVYAYARSTVHAYPGTIVTAGPCVAVHRHPAPWGGPTGGRNVYDHEVHGGVHIEHPDVATQHDVATWCAYYGVEVEGDRAYLYKVVDDDLVAGHGYRPTAYPIDAVVYAPDWDDHYHCGGGLHLAPTPVAAAFWSGQPAERYLRCKVNLADIRSIVDLDSPPKCKVAVLRVVAEVDLTGCPVGPATAAPQARA